MSRTQCEPCGHRTLSEGLEKEKNLDGPRASGRFLENDRNFTGPERKERKEEEGKVFFVEKIEVENKGNWGRSP